MKKYRCLAQNEWAIDSYSVTCIQPEHIQTIRVWRNEQIDVLRQAAPLSPDQQERYYAAKIWPTMEDSQPDNILLSYFLNGTHIGYGGLVHVSWENRRAEVSFLVAPPRAMVEETYEADFSSFLKLMKILAFDDLGLNRLCTETYSFRFQTISILEGAGFRHEGTLRQHVIKHGTAVDSVMHGCLAAELRAAVK